MLSNIRFARKYHINPKNQINTIIFDLYDTIILPKKHFRPAPVQAFIDTFNNYDCEIKSINDFTKLINKHMGKGKLDHLKCILDDQSMNSFKLKIKNVTIDEMYKVFSKKQCEILENPDYTILDPDYYKTIELLRTRNVKYFCATTGFNQKMTKIILNNNPGLRLDKIITTDDVVLSRPNPEGINKIIRTFETTRLQCIKLGDTCTDIVEATNAFTYGIGITTSLPKNEFFNVGAYATVDRLIELPQIVDKINNE
jgi:HAD superfamily hydrolase (TIGR01549 family)